MIIIDRAWLELKELIHGYVEVRIIQKSANLRRAKFFDIFKCLVSNDWIRIVNFPDNLEFKKKTKRLAFGS